MKAAPPVWRRHVWPTLRWLTTAAAVWFLLPRAVRPLRPVWEGRTLLWLAGALAVTALATVLAAVRWHRVLAVVGLPARVPALVSHHFAGLFVSNFLPSTIGGDVLRVSRLAATTGESPRTFASVVLERLTGWIVLPMISLLALAVNPGLLEPPIRRAATVAMAISVVTLSLLVVLVMVAWTPRVGVMLTDSAGWRRFASAVHLGFHKFRRGPAATLEVLAAGLVYQLAVVLGSFFAAKALGLDEVSWTVMLAFMPAVAMVQVLPLTIGGLGMREGAFVLFLHPLGVTTNQAIALGVLVYGINLAVSLLGAPAFAAGTRRAPVPA